MGSVSHNNTDYVLYFPVRRHRITVNSIWMNILTGRMHKLTWWNAPDVIGEAELTQQAS